MSITAELAHAADITKLEQRARQHLKRVKFLNHKVKRLERELADLNEKLYRQQTQLTDVVDAPAGRGTIVYCSPEPVEPRRLHPDFPGWVPQQVFVVAVGDQKYMYTGAQLQKVVDIGSWLP